MTGYQEGYEKMSLAGVSFLMANATITAKLTGFDIYFPVIQSTHTQIQAAKVLQEADKSGNTTTKNQYRDTLISGTMEIVRRTVAYATNVNNSALLALVNYTESGLKRSSDTKLISSCQVVHDNANANVAALATYGVTADMITTMQTNIANLSGALPKGRVGETDSEEATNQLATYFKTLKTNWAKIDTLVKMVQTSEPSFYNEYVNVRKIIPAGVGSLPLKIKATNAATGAPEANVTITLTPVNGLMKAAAANGKGNVVKKTAAGGGSNYKSVPDGTYTVEAEKPGFKKVIETVSVVNGEFTVLEIVMEKV
jgi:hypothetical protein